MKITITKKEYVCIECKKSQKKSARKMLKAIGAKEFDWLESTDTDEFSLLGEIKYKQTIVDV